MANINGINKLSSILKHLLNSSTKLIKREASIKPVKDKCIAVSEIIEINMEETKKLKKPSRVLLP
jgi:hypothetical protein